MKGKPFHRGMTTRFSWTYILRDVWNLAFSVAIPHHNSKTYWLTLHSHSRYHLNNVLGRNLAAKSHSKGPNSTKVITWSKYACPPRKKNLSLCINGQCTTRDSRYKKHKSEQLPWKLNSLFWCDLDMWFSMWWDNFCHGQQQNVKCLQIFETC